MDTQKLPGVTLTLISTVVKRAIEGKKQVVEARLLAKIEDEKVWDEVVEKLKNLRIYTIEDIRGEIVNVLNDELEGEKRTREELARRVKQLEYERAVLTVEVEQSRAVLSTLRALRGLYISPST